MKARIKQWNEPPVNRINIVSLGTFEFVAAIAGSTEVIRIVAATQGPRHDVVDDKRHPNNPSRG